MKVFTLISPLKSSDRSGSVYNHQGTRSFIRPASERDDVTRGKKVGCNSGNEPFDRCRCIDQEKSDGSMEAETQQNRFRP